jgi:hypothetical protein
MGQLRDSTSMNPNSKANKKINFRNLEIHMHASRQAGVGRENKAKI